MTAIVTVQLFAGRQDPTWTLSAEQQAELLRRLGAAEPADSAGLSPEPGLGYRGLSVEIQAAGLPPVRWHIHRGRTMCNGTRLQDRQRLLERWLIESGRQTLTSDLLAYLETELEN